MGGAIGPGDFVECAPRSDIPREISPEAVKFEGERPKRGKLYQVRQCGQFRSLAGKLYDGIRLVGVKAIIPAHSDAWLLADDFKPISSGERGMFDHMLKAPTGTSSWEPIAA